jgi:Family of unknown function (DUF6455)
MIPLLRMLELCGLSLSDAESGGFEELAQAARRCQRCRKKNPCIRWLQWRGRYGEAPACLNSGYFVSLRARPRRGA